MLDGPRELPLGGGVARARGSDEADLKRRSTQQPKIVYSGLRKRVSAQEKKKDRTSSECTQMEENPTSEVVISSF